VELAAGLDAILIADWTPVTLVQTSGVGPFDGNDFTIGYDLGGGAPPATEWTALTSTIKLWTPVTVFHTAGDGGFDTDDFENGYDLGGGEPPGTVWTKVLATV
jgi:hypothetical protein